MEPPASAAWRRGMAPRVIIVLLSAGLVLLLVVSLPSLVYGPERTLTLVSQDFPFDNTTYRAGLSRSFWLSAAESIRPELVESITNRSTGALIWQGPVFAVFLHYPLGESGPPFWPPMVAPRDGYYPLEVHHHECQDEVDLCQAAAADLSYRTSGSLRIVAPRPYPFLAPSVAVLAATGSGAGLGLIAWRFARRRFRPLETSGTVKANHWRTVTAAALLVVALVGIGSLGLDAIYRSHVSAQANGFGSSGFASDNPCVPGQTNMMRLYVSAYNGADEEVTIWVEVRTGGAPIRITGISVPAHAMTLVGVGIYPSTDCKDPAAQIRITGIWPLL